ncbi:ParA family protein, partial [Mycobacteriaceae bacterium Msp059]|nr:ParA family protein [Mycobacteriaceae bacterium Msp059]
FDRRNGIDQSIRERVEKEFGEEVRAEVPRRAVVNEAFQLGSRLGDYADPTAMNLARIFRDFLERDLLGRNPGDR